MKTSIAVFLCLFSLLPCRGQTPAVELDLSNAELTAEGHEIYMGPLDASRVTITAREGRWAAAVRISSPGAAGLQFLIEGLRLPAGVQLAVSGASIETGQAPRAIYEGAGPLNGDPFWTVAVPGSEAIIEVIYADMPVAGIPFRLAAVRSLNADGLEKLSGAARTVEMLEDPQAEGSKGFARFRGVEVPYVVRGGMALFEGDIVLGPVSALETAPAKTANTAREAVAVSSTAYRWPNGVAPYVIDAALPNQSRVTNAIAHWNNSLGGKITLKPRTNESYYLRFAYTTNAGTCSSYIGMVRVAAQPVTLGNYCSTGNAIHEIGHAIGLFHEHTREDRNAFVRILWANVNTTHSSDFNQNIAVSTDMGAYDYGSIMHYGPYAFSVNGQPTIETIPPGIAIGQRSGLSAGDIAAVRALYSSSTPAGSVQVTVASSPAGRQLWVDGAAVIAPAVFQWTPGSSHTVSAASSTSGGTRYLFARWSDNGAATHTIAAPSSAATLTAYYTVQYKVTAVSGNTMLGDVAMSPASADSYYEQGAAVNLAAVSSNACFTDWTGIAAPPSSPLQVAVSQPYDITGNFQTGAVTLSTGSLTFEWKSGGESFGVTANGACPWTASTAANWITLDSAAGRGSGTVTFRVSTNTTKAARQGTIMVNGMTVSVAQKAR